MNRGITFIIAAQIDSSDRLDNLELVLARISRFFHNSVTLLIEADSETKITKSYPGVNHIFYKLENNEVFNKMKLYNLGALKANSSVLCFLDTDVPPCVEAVGKAFELIDNNTYDVVYPYVASQGYNVPKEHHGEILKSPCTSTYDTEKYPWLASSTHIPYIECGGIVLCSASTFCNSGGGNEGFVGWGCEDDELLARLTILGYRIGRVEDGIVLHLIHERPCRNSWYDYGKYEGVNRYKLALVRAMTRQQVLEMISSWNHFDKNTQECTVIICASYLDSHPDISFIQEVIESLALTGLPDTTPIILSHDKIKPGTEGEVEKEQQYQKYFENLEKYIVSSPYKNTKILKASEWGHLTRSLKNAVSQVATKYMLVLQHDIHIRRNIPIQNMMELMEKHKHIKHLRFNVRKNLPTFIWWDGYTGGKRAFAEEEYDGVKICFTPAWSDQNHLSTKEYYETVVFPDCSDGYGELIYDFMENKLNGMCHHNHERYGTYIYGEFGAPRTSRHSDGRKSSPEKDED